MSTLTQDLRFAARTMQRNPGFTFLAVLALALGIGANTAVFTVLHGVLLRPLPFPEADRLQLISYAGKRGPFGPGMGLSEEPYFAVQRENQSFEGVASFARERFSLTGSGEPVRLPGANVTPEFFRILRVNPVWGRNFLPEDLAEGHEVVLIGDDLWRNRFAADTNIVGRVIQLDGISRKVIGVMPAGFAFPYSAQVWTPFEVRITPGNSWMRPVVGRLKPGASPQRALSELQAITTRIDPNPSRNNPPVAEILPLKDLLVGQVRESLWIFAGAVAFVLLIACANVTNLLLMRAASRQQEIAVRAAMGAGRWRLIRQLLTESTLVSLAGGAAGVLVALWGVPALVALAPEGRIPRASEIHIDAAVLAFTLAVSVLTGIAFGLVPSLHATRGQVRDTLSLGVRTASARHGALRNGLAVAEIALALVLLTGAGLLVKSFLRLQAVDPGFRAENVMTMTVDPPTSIYKTAPQFHVLYERLLAKLAATPGITAAGAVNFLPMAKFGIKGDFGAETRARRYMADKQVVSAGYFQVMGIRMLSGRDFSDHDAGGAPRVVIVSQSVARAVWPGEDPIGKRITGADNPGPNDWTTVVGVVDDIHQADLQTRAGSALYYPLRQSGSTVWLSHMTFAVRTSGDPASIAPAMRAALHEVDPNQPVEAMASMRDVVTRTTAEPLFQARLLTLFSGLALALAAIGIYGVLAHSVASRTREIGIRMALGAEGRDVMRMVLRRTLVLTSAGVAIGAAGALLTTRVLANLLFDVKPYDAPTFLAVALVLSAVAMAAGWVPARRATQVDPMVALRWE